MFDDTSSSSVLDIDAFLDNVTKGMDLISLRKKDIITSLLMKCPGLKQPLQDYAKDIEDTEESVKLKYVITAQRVWNKTDLLDDFFTRVAEAFERSPPKYCNVDLSWSVTHGSIDRLIVQFIADRSSIPISAEEKEKNIWNPFGKTENKGEFKTTLTTECLRLWTFYYRERCRYWLFVLDHRTFIEAPITDLGLHLKYNRYIKKYETRMYKNKKRLEEYLSNTYYKSPTVHETKLADIEKIVETSEMKSLNGLFDKEQKEWDEVEEEEEEQQMGTPPLPFSNMSIE